MGYEPVEAINVTKFFSRDILIYSLFDLKLKKPFRLVYALYFMLMLVIWSAPMFFLLKGFGISFVTLTIILGPSFIGAYVMGNPFWGGKSFFDFLNTQINYLKEPKAYYDWRANLEMGTQIIDFEVTVSRRKDYLKLYELDRKEREWRKNLV